MARNSGKGNSGKGNSDGGSSSTKGQIGIKLDSDPNQEGFQPSVNAEISIGIAETSYNSASGELGIGFDVGFGRGGIVIDTKTGEIIEQSAGFSLTGFFDYDVKELKCEKILTVTFKFLSGAIGWTFTEREKLNKPGCEPPPEPEPEPEPGPIPPPPLPPLDDNLEGMFILGFNSFGYKSDVFIPWGEYHHTSHSISVYLEGFTTDDNGNLTGYQWGARASSQLSTKSWNQAPFTSSSNSSGSYLVSFVEPPDKTGWLLFWDGFWGKILFETGPDLRESTTHFFGTWRDVKEFILAYNNAPMEGQTNAGWGWSVGDSNSYAAGGGSSYYTILYYPGMPPPKPPPPKLPPLPPSPPENDMDDCCKTTLKLVKEMHKVLGTKRLLTQGFSVPNRLMMPRTTGTSTAKNFLEIAEIQLRVSDHLGIHPFTVVVKDVDPTKAGDQPLYQNINSGSYALKEILQYLIDINADGDANTNIAVRSAYLQTQMMTTLASQSKKIECLIDGLGIGTKQSQEKVLVPFNPGVNGKAKGFDPKKAQVIDNNTEMTTEALLPELLQSRELPFPTEKFTGKHDIMELLYAIFAQTSKQ